MPKHLTGQPETGECLMCRESMTFVRLNGIELAYETDTGLDHECWLMPAGAELLVLED